MEVTPSEIENSGSIKRRKVGNEELWLCSLKLERVTGFESDDFNQSADVTSFNFYDQLVLCCSSNETVIENVNCVDLEVEIGTSTTETMTVDSGDMDDWRRFKEAGLLDEAIMERKDRVALVRKTAQLEKKLYDYQYNMGLLLLENDELATNTKKLRASLVETHEVVKQEEATYYMAISKVEKQADNSRNTLDYEKRCRADLEQELREIDEENKQMKLIFQSSLTDANALVAGIVDKAREEKEKTHQGDAKLVELNRKSLDLCRRMQELETHESVLQSERKYFVTRCEEWEDTYAKHKTDLQEWKKKDENKGGNCLDFSVNILVIGKAGVDKSATINSIFDSLTSCVIGTNSTSCVRTKCLTTCF